MDLPQKYSDKILNNLSVHPRYKKMVNVCCTFPNSEVRVQFTCEDSALVSEVKQFLLTAKWPQSLLSPEAVGTIRLISLGKILKDTCQLKDIRLRGSTEPIPLLVHYTKKDDFTTREVTVPYCCCVSF